MGDVSGVRLDPKAHKMARMEEVQYIHTMGSYINVFIAQCCQHTGKTPISARWVDINKGDVGRRDYRSRSVACEINTHTHTHTQTRGFVRGDASIGSIKNEIINFSVG